MNYKRYAVVCLGIFWIMFSSVDAYTRVERNDLKNKLTFIFNQNTSNNIISVSVFVKAGTWYETADNSGISNFCQQLLLRGTSSSSRDEINLAIESMGGSFHTQTSDDYSELSLTIPKRNFEKAFLLLFNIIKNPVFDPDEIKKVKKDIIASIKSRNDKIFNYTYDLFNNAVYGEYPYARSYLGTDKSISHLTQENFIEFHSKIYRPDNMCLVITGNINKDSLYSLVQETFGSLRGKADLMLMKPPKLPSRKDTYSQTSIKNFHQAYLMLGYPVDGIHSKYYGALKLINAYIGEGMGSKIFMNIRDREGLAYEIGSFYPSRLNKSRFVIYMGLDDANVDKTKKMILEEINQLTIKLISEKELQNIKNFIKGTFLLDHETNYMQGWYLGWYEIIGKKSFYDRLYLAEIDKVTAKDILKAAKKFFTDDNLIIIIVKPSVE